MQTVSLQFDLLSGAGDNFDVGNAEGAQWPKLDEEQKDETVLLRELLKRKRISQYHLLELALTNQLNKSLCLVQ